MCMSVAHYVHAQQSSPRVTSALQEHRSIHDAREGRGGEGSGGATLISPSSSRHQRLNNTHSRRYLKVTTDIEQLYTNLLGEVQVLYRHGQK